MSEHRVRCRDISGVLSAYLEHELEDQETANVRAHLDRCPVCRADAQRLGRALGALHALRPSEMPDSVRSGLYARIAVLERPQPSPLRRLRYAGAAAVAVLSVASAAYLASRARPGDLDATDPMGVQLGRVVRSGGLDRSDGSDGSRVAEAPGVADRQGSTDATDGARQAGWTDRTGRTGPLQPPIRRRTVRTAPIPDSMLDVADGRGVTARMLLAAGAGSEPGPAPLAASGATVRSVLPVPGMPRALGDAHGGEWRDRVRIGDTVTELRGTADRDTTGRLRAIRVSATTASALEPDGQTDASEPSAFPLSGVPAEPGRSDEMER